MVRLPEDKEIFDCLVERHIVFHLANVGNVVIVPYLAFATWCFLYYDQHNKFYLLDLDALPIQEAKAAVSPKMCFEYCDRHNI